MENPPKREQKGRKGGMGENPPRKGKGGIGENPQKEQKEQKEEKGKRKLGGKVPPQKHIKNVLSFSLKNTK